MQTTPALSSITVHSDGLSMHEILIQPSLRTSMRDFEKIMHEARGLCADLSDVEFNRSPGPKRWSAAQCIEHLNLSGYEMALPAIDRLIAKTSDRGLPSKREYRNGRLSEWFIRNCDASSKRRFKTMKRFETTSFLAVDETLERFLRLQELLIERLIQADELDLGAMKARNAAMIPLNLEQWFRFTAAHERRHLEQGKESRKD